MTSPAGPGADRGWGLLGVPSSAAAHWPGIEKAPAALRAAGLVKALRATGLALEDHGDLPVTRWQAARTDGGPNNVLQVVDVLVPPPAQSATSWTPAGVRWSWVANARC